MTIIKRREIRVAPSTEEEPPIRYCPHCLEFGFEVKLGPKILPKGETKTPDYQQWKQCHDCGNTYSINELKTESAISSDFTATDSPDDIQPNIIGIGNKKPYDRKERDRQRVLDSIDAIKDEDIRREVRKGHKVTIDTTYDTSDDYPINAYLGY